MTAVAEQPEAELSVPVDYVPGARGYAVFAAGLDGEGAEAMAIWRLGPTGYAGPIVHPTGYLRMLESTPANSY